MFMAARRGLLQSYLGKTTWRIYISFRKDVVTHITSAYVTNLGVIWLDPHNFLL